LRKSEGRIRADDLLCCGIGSKEQRIDSADSYEWRSHAFEAASSL
jgi:hypothetical protein